jgi:16S rRNA (guanine1516-N2)-methyltransferase
LPVLVTFEISEGREKAKALAKRLNLMCAKSPGIKRTHPHLLHVSPEGLQLIQTSPSIHRISTEFVTGPLGYRRLKGGGKNQAIARAVGLKNYKGILNVLDATAGLGRDAFVLAGLGCKVQLIERSPIMIALIEDGIERARAKAELMPILQRMQVIKADAKHFLKALSKEAAPEVVYLDPLFIPTKKSALTKIEMRCIRDIVGEDLDADELLPLAKLKAKKRVVVKRWRSAPFLLGEPPSFQIVGKSNRYDVYITQNESFGETST